jgi:hypothetical protein
MSNRTSILQLGAVLLATSIGHATAPRISAVPAPVAPWRQPVITYLDAPTPQQRETIAWAIERYHEAGLQLPDLTISFPAICSGKGALYHVGQRSIDFCRVNKRRALHELAHAWDDTSGAVDRDAFLRLRGLSVWWGGTDRPSSEQGAEQLAQIVAWGLQGANPSDVPQLPNNDVATLVAAYVSVVGTPPLPAIG